VKDALPRKLWYEDALKRVTVSQKFLQTDHRSLVILGEAGMGKSTLLEQLRGIDGYTVCTARRLLNAANPTALLGEAATLVIDALDEVSAQRDGDAVDAVVAKLDALGGPRFILSCRVADWRSATGLEGVREVYGAAPLELHLEPLDRADAAAFLSRALGQAKAEETLKHLEGRGLDGLWSNPQTLDLVRQVAAEGQLPSSKGQLFSDATKLLRQEHRETKSSGPLASMPEAEVLDAAGAAFAGEILIGADSLSRLANVAHDDLPLREVSALPGAARILDILDSRLFAAGKADKFTYAHRAVGEFLGARWLARQADTPRKQRRLLELFNGQGLVPASLRGIHAWLAYHSSDLAVRVIAADPMGVIEYGDADRLSVVEGRALFTALRALSQANPRFRGWTEYRAGGLVQAGLLAEVRAVLTEPEVEFGLRLLVLQALKGSPLVQDLAEVLLGLLRDRSAAYANRLEAGELMAALVENIDWPALVAELRAQDDEDGSRLAGELIDEVGYDRFSDVLIADVILAQTRRSHRTVGLFFRLERSLSVQRLDGLLDAISTAAAGMSENEIAHYTEFKHLALALVARRLKWRDPAPARLWAWLKAFRGQSGLDREARDVIANALQANDVLRRQLQRHVLLDSPGDKTAWERVWWLRERVPGADPTETDVVVLLNALESRDERWRDLVQLVPHSLEAGDVVRAAAKRVAAGDSKAQAWIDRLAEPRVFEWQIEDEERRRKDTAERKALWQTHRTEFAAHIDDLKTGVYGRILNPAKAYLNLFHDMGDETADGPGRLEEWLGAELRDAALTGFDRFLKATPPHPSATQIAESHAEGRHWDAAYILVAALAERLRTGQGFDDLSDERLMAGLFEIRHSPIDDHAGFPELDGVLAVELKRRGAWTIAQDLYFEPQFVQRRNHVDGLYSLMRDPADVAFATARAIDWLRRFPDMPEAPEFELIDRLITSQAGRAVLRELTPLRRGHSGASDERRRSWDAVGLTVKFDVVRADLEANPPIEAELLWHLRARQGAQRQGGSAIPLSADQIAWTISTFRSLHPWEARPDRVTTGDTNAWDATNYLTSMINRLGDDASDLAIRLLSDLRDDEADGYTEILRVASAEQKRKRVEADWQAPDFATVASVVTDTVPTTAAQLQTVVLEELDVVQDKLRGHELDWYRDFFRDGSPRGEEDCRDALLKMLAQMPFGIHALPEAHLADNKRADIMCLLGNLMVPVEIKGQWHPKLWTAADQQLDRLYNHDWRAERGIYLVLWFGRSSTKPPASTPQGVARPETAEQLRNALAERSVTTREGRVEVVVLDLSRPA
jgi:hypothetical protein